MWRNWNPLHCWWECKMVQPLCKTGWQFLKKIKNRITIWSNNSTSGHMPKKVKAGLLRHICTPMFIEASFATLRRCPSMEERSVHTMEYYSARTRKEAVTHFTTGLNLEDVTLNEISQSQEDKHYMIPIQEVLGQIQRQNDGRRGWGGGENEQLMFYGSEFTLTRCRVLGADGSDGCTAVWLYLTPLTHTLEICFGEGWRGGGAPGFQLWSE